MTAFCSPVICECVVYLYTVCNACIKGSACCYGQLIQCAVQLNRVHTSLLVWYVSIICTCIVILMFFFFTQISILLSIVCWGGHNRRWQTLSMNTRVHSKYEQFCSTDICLHSVRTTFSSNRTQKHLTKGTKAHTSNDLMWTLHMFVVVAYVQLCCVCVCVWCVPIAHKHKVGWVYKFICFLSWPFFLLLRSANRTYKC